MYKEPAASESTGVIQMGFLEDLHKNLLSETGEDVPSSRVGVSSKFQRKSIKCYTR